MTKTQPIIHFVNLTYTYPDCLEPSVKVLNIAVHSGEWIHIVGPAGSGKTTICSLLSGALQSWPGGTLTGELWVDGRDHTRSTALEAAGKIGIVPQHPESSLIHEFVMDELAFGPENLCVPPEEIDKRIAQALEAVGMSEAKHSKTSELSGGQQQRIAIASVLTMNPSILVFDNTAGNLDAAAAEQLTGLLKELHRQGRTILTTAARLDPQCGADRVILLEKGHVTADGPLSAIRSEHQERLFRIGAWNNASRVHTADVHTETGSRGNPFLQARRLSYAYGPGQPPVLEHIDMECYLGDFWAILGPNGSGKTTLGKLIAGLLSPPPGSIFIDGKDIAKISWNDHSRRIGYLFQRPEHQFVAHTVLEECAFGLRHLQSSPDHIDHTGELWLERFGLLDHKDRNPFTLTLAEKRLLNLAAATIVQPDILLLDEPTAGLDFRISNLFMGLCADYARQGKIVIMMTHDLEMAERWATKTRVFGR